MSAGMRRHVGVNGSGIERSSALRQAGHGSPPSQTVRFLNAGNNRPTNGSPASSLRSSRRFISTPRPAPSHPGSSRQHSATGIRPAMGPASSNRRLRGCGHAGTRGQIRPVPFTFPVYLPPAMVKRSKPALFQCSVPSSASSPWRRASNWS